MVLLALDTTSGSCAAALFSAGGQELAVLEESRKSGHAEWIAPAVEKLLSMAGLGKADLSKIAVAVGPGSFTGIRTGVAGARGLALALSVPVVGVTTLAALAADGHRELGRTPLLTAIDAGRREVYMAVYDHYGRPIMTPQRMPYNDSEQGSGLAGGQLRCVGNGAVHLGLEADAFGDAGSGSIRSLALLGLASVDDEAPEPLYLRSPDATPPPASARVPLQGGTAN